MEISSILWPRCIWVGIRIEVEFRVVTRLAFGWLHVAVWRVLVSSVVDFISSQFRWGSEISTIHIILVEVQRECWYWGLLRPKTAFSFERLWVIVFDFNFIGLKSFLFGFAKNWNWFLIRSMFKSCCCWNWLQGCWLLNCLVAYVRSLRGCLDSRKWAEVRK